MIRALLTITFLALTLSASGATFTVNSLGDAPDATPGDGLCAAPGGECTLRAAIQEANTTGPGDEIHFSVSGIIAPATELPAITTRIWIAGATFSDPPPRITIDGGGTLATGIHFAAGSDDAELRYVQIYGFTDTGVRISSDSIELALNYIGPVTGGTPNRDGVTLWQRQLVLLERGLRQQPVRHHRDRQRTSVLSQRHR
jgi:CSLREA domain-containing protein